MYFKNKDIVRQIKKRYPSFDFKKDLSPREMQLILREINKSKEKIKIEERMLLIKKMVLIPGTKVGPKSMVKKY